MGWAQPIFFWSDASGEPGPHGAERLGGASDRESAHEADGEVAR